MAFRTSAFKNALAKPPARQNFHNLDMKNAFILRNAASELKLMAAEGSSSN